MTEFAKRAIMIVVTNILIVMGIASIAHRVFSFSCNDERYAFQRCVDCLFILPPIIVSFMEIYSRALCSRIDAFLYRIYAVAIWSFVLPLFLKMVTLWPYFSQRFSHAEIWRWYWFITFFSITGYMIYALLSPGKRKIVSAGIIWPILYMEGVIIFHTYWSLLGFIAWFITLLVYAVISYRKKELRLVSSLAPAALFGSLFGFFVICWVIFRRFSEILV